MLAGIFNVAIKDKQQHQKYLIGVNLMSVGLFCKRTEYTAVALHPGVFQGIVIYFNPKGKIARKVRVS
jgi:hypothetical protein